MRAGSPQLLTRYCEGSARLHRSIHIDAVLQVLSSVPIIMLQMYHELF